MLEKIAPWGARWYQAGPKGIGEWAGVGLSLRPGGSNAQQQPRQYAAGPRLDQAQHRARRNARVLLPITGLMETLRADSTGVNVWSNEHGDWRGFDDVHPVEVLSPSEPYVLRSVAGTAEPSHIKRPLVIVVVPLCFCCAAVFTGLSSQLPVCEGDTVRASGCDYERIVFQRALDSHFFGRSTVTTRAPGSRFSPRGPKSAVFASLCESARVMLGIITFTCTF